MKLDRRWWGTSVVRGRVLLAGLLLLGAGVALLGRSSRTHHFVARTANAPLADGQMVVSQAHARSLFAGLPLMFEPNQGQGYLDASDARAKFVARGSGYSLFLGNEGAMLALASKNAAKQGAELIQMKLAGMNRDASVNGNDPLSAKSNYIIGNNPKNWRMGVPEFARVSYANVYPGIDLVFYGNQGHLEYDFQVAPGADPSQAALEFNGVKGLELQDGALVLKTASQSLRLEAPQVYQEIAGKKQPVEGSFVLRADNRVGFAIGAYDHSRELVIDPILSFSTYFGGSGDEHATSIAVDGSLNVYIAGSTTSTNLPASGTFQTTLKGAQNVYIAKITPPLGSIAAAVDYITYLGGDGTDYPVGIKVDGAGDAFVAGTTTSTDFPTSPNAYQTVAEASSPAGSKHVFVTKLNPSVTAPLLYSSYLSGNGAADVASGMTIDAFGNVFVTGTTDATDASSTTDQFPASSAPQAFAYQPIPRSSIQFFVTKVNTAAPGVGSIAFSTYFGGGSFQTPTPVAVGGGVTVDSSGNIYFSGTTNFTYTGCAGCGTTDFPILNAYQPCLDQTPPSTVVNPPACVPTSTTTAKDGFVAKLNPAANQGQQLKWSTYVGGEGDDSVNGVALDTGAANVYAVGTTNSQTFVASGTLAALASYQKCLNNIPQTTTTTTPTCTAQTNPPNDAFVVRLTNPANTTGTSTNVSLGYFSYLGGANNEAGTAITVDSASGAVVTGWTQSPFTAADGTFPVYPNPNSIQGALNGTQDAFIGRINTAATVGQTTVASWLNYFGGTGSDAGTGVTLDVNQNTYLAGETNSTDLQVNKPLASNTTNSGGYDAFVAQLGTAVSLSIQGELSLGTNQTFVPAGSPATFTYTVTNNGPDLASNITVTADLRTSTTIVPLTNVTASVTSGSCGAVSSSSTLSCSIPSLQSGSTVTVTIVATPTGTASGGQASFNGGTVQAIGPGNIVLAQTSVSATLSDFSMSVNPKNNSVVKAGDTATYNVQLTPLPLYSSNISVSCSGNPANSSCAWSPGSTITLQGASGSTATLSVVTTPRPVVTGAVRLSPRFFYAIGFVIPGLIFVAGIGGGRRKRIAGMMMLVCMLMAVVLLPACSGGKSQQAPSAGTPAGSYTITITASAGSDSKSQTVNLTVP